MVPQFITTSEASWSTPHFEGETGKNIGPSNSSRQIIDEAMMVRCIELSRIAVGKGEYPFGTVIACDGKNVAEAINRTVRQGDVKPARGGYRSIPGAQDDWPRAASSLHALH